MKKYSAVLAMVAVVAVMSMSSAAWASYYTTAASGDWSSSGTWNGGVPGPGDDADISHVVTLNVATMPINYAVVRGGAELKLGGNDISTYYSVDIQGVVSGLGTVTVGPGDGMGLYDGGVITANFNAIRFNVWMNGQQFTMAHGTSGNFNWLGGANNTINITQQAGQTDGVSLGALTLPDGNKLNLTFDAGSGAAAALPAGSYTDKSLAAAFGEALYESGG